VSARVKSDGGMSGQSPDARENKYKDPFYQDKYSEIAAIN
jgi:hypothetical protein